MKAFLLAAGHGTRLRPLTDNLPKCLVPIRGIPILDIWLQLCRRAAITDLFVNLNAHAASVRTALRHHKNGLKIRLSEEQILLGSAGTLRANRDWVTSDSEFWVLYSDVLTTFELSKMMAFHRSRRPAATIGLYQVKDPSRCGVVLFDSQRVVREFEEKPVHPKSNWVFSGLLIATPELLDAIPPQSPVDLGFHVLPKLAGRMLAYPISDYLLDIGTMENYHTAQTTWPGIPG
ncbi:MAG: nucleotidyl transferase [Acidobacteria bacterium]|nr:MAG: nucleotidyl transferase [Acidobacteriota bacterium]